MARPPYRYSQVVFGVKTMIIAIREPARARLIVEQFRQLYNSPHQ